MLQQYAEALSLKNDQATLARIKRFFNITSIHDLYYQVANHTIGEQELAQCFGKAKTAPSMFFLGPYKNIFDKESENESQQPASLPSSLSQHLSPFNFQVDKDFESFDIQPASCCKPVQGDAVVGIMDEGKIYVHRTNCKVAMDEMANHENKIVRAKWKAGEDITFLSGIAVTAIDKKGLLQELTQVITQDMNLNMRAITLEASEGVMRGIIMLYVHSLDNLNKLIESIRAIEGVDEVRRI